MRARSSYAPTLPFWGERSPTFTFTRRITTVRLIASRRVASREQPDNEQGAADQLHEHHHVRHEFRQWEAHPREDLTKVRRSYCSFCNPCANLIILTITCTTTGARPASRANGERLSVLKNPSYCLKFLGYTIIYASGRWMVREAYKRFLRDLGTGGGERQLCSSSDWRRSEPGVYNQQVTVVYAPRGLIDYPSGA
jgi:hypothetical protein